MNADFINGASLNTEAKQTGRWSREEHEKFIEGMQRFVLYHFNYSNEFIWKRLEKG